MTRRIRFIAPMGVLATGMLAGIAATASAEPFDSCGTFVLGLEGCVLFQPDGGGEQVNPGPPSPPLMVGDRARVQGTLVSCTSFCFAPCVEGAVVSSCPTPCRADFDANGSVGVNDIFAFLSAWFAGSAGADFDHSGSVAVNDIFAFLGAWFAGC